MFTPKFLKYYGVDPKLSTSFENTYAYLLVCKIIRKSTPDFS